MYGGCEFPILKCEFNKELDNSLKKKFKLYRFCESSKSGSSKAERTLSWLAIFLNLGPAPLHTHRSTHSTHTQTQTSPPHTHTQTRPFKTHTGPPPHVPYRCGVCESRRRPLVSPSASPLSTNAPGHDTDNVSSPGGPLMLSDPAGAIQTSGQGL